MSSKINLGAIPNLGANLKAMPKPPSFLRVASLNAFSSMLSNPVFSEGLTEEELAEKAVMYAKNLETQLNKEESKQS